MRRRTPSVDYTRPTMPESSESVSGHSGDAIPPAYPNHTPSPSRHARGLSRPASINLNPIRRASASASPVHPFESPAPVYAQPMAAYTSPDADPERLPLHATSSSVSSVSSASEAWTPHATGHRYTDSATYLNLGPLESDPPARRPPRPKSASLHFLPHQLSPPPSPPPGTPPFQQIPRSSSIKSISSAIGHPSSHARHISATVSHLTKRGHRRYPYIVYVGVLAVASLLVMLAYSVYTAPDLEDYMYYDDSTYSKAQGADLRNEMLHAPQNASSWAYLSKIKESVKSVWNDHFVSSNFYGDHAMDSVVFNASKYTLHNTPQKLIRKQLRPDMRYLFVISYGGHANQFINLMNLLHMAQITKRVTIMPPLMPVHIDSHMPQDVGTFYDMSRFYALTQLPALEFSNMKIPDYELTSPINEVLPCWSVQEITVGFGNTDNGSMSVFDSRAVLWPLPDRVSIPRDDYGSTVFYEGFGIFDYDVPGKAAWIDTVREGYLPQNDSNEVAPEPDALLANVKEGFEPFTEPVPDDQLVCIDNTLFLQTMQFSKTDALGEPLLSLEEDGWRNIGQHIFFTHEVETHVDQILTQLFGVAAVRDVPPLITLHVRRGDFKDFAGYTSLRRYEDAVSDVVRRLAARDLNAPVGDDEEFITLNTNVSLSEEAGPTTYSEEDDNLDALPAPDYGPYSVVCTTDELSNSTFVQQMRRRGWKVVLHDPDELNTAARLGSAWWPTIIDSALLARGSGFVGTRKSTYSQLAALRVKYWRGGLSAVA